MNTEQMKYWIDHASYHQLLAKQRMEPGDSPWLNGDVGEYLDRALATKRRSTQSKGLRREGKPRW